MGSRVVPWFISLPASMFYCLAASAMQETHDSARGNHPILGIISQLLLASSVALWVLNDARRRGESLHYDAGAFFFFAWPVLAPIYLVSTRRWRGLVTIGWFVLLYLTAVSIGSIPYFIRTFSQ